MISSDLVCPLPGYPSLKVFDPTGAGDSFAGGMMGYLASKGLYDFRDLVRGMAYGTVTASFTIEDFSVRRLERLTLEEIEGRLQMYRGMLEF
jgi:sugar/nucleoside kinase (ribokinase family)